MTKIERAAKNSSLEEHSSPISVMASIDGMTLSSYILKMEVQLEIPDLAPVDCPKTCLIRTAKRRIKKKSPTPHEQDILIDPRQMQLAFASA